MRVIYNFSSIPERYNNNFVELEKKISKYDLAFTLIPRFFQEIKKPTNIYVQHKPIKKNAQFYKNTIYLNFANDMNYLWAGICHESAHILLRQAGWTKTKIYKEFKKIKIEYDVDQSCAILVQAYYENIAGIRKLNWKEWELTFTGMQVGKIGKVLFDRFRKSVNNKDFSILKFINQYSAQLE